jgi:hypothetical protein
MQRMPFRRVLQVVALVGAIAVIVAAAKAALPSDCIVLPHKSPSWTEKPNPLALPYCGYDTEPVFEGQRRLRLSDFRLRCGKRQVAIDITILAVGNASWRCTSSAHQVAAYYKKYAAVFAGKVNPNSLPGEEAKAFRNSRG